jgi:hypothetical protein
MTIVTTMLFQYARSRVMEWGLQLAAVAQVARVAQTRNDILVVVENRIDDRAP